MQTNKILHFPTATLHTWKQAVKLPNGKMTSIAPIILEGKEKPSTYFFAVLVPEKGYWKMFDVRMVFGYDSIIWESYPEAYERPIWSQLTKMVYYATKDGFRLHPIIKTSVKRRSRFETIFINSIKMRNIDLIEFSECQSMTYCSGILANLIFFQIKDGLIQFIIAHSSLYIIISEKGQVELSCPKYKIAQGWKKARSFSLEMEADAPHNMGDFLDLAETFFLKIRISFEDWKEKNQEFIQSFIKTEQV